jgi:hypothetical protein
MGVFIFDSKGRHTLWVNEYSLGTPLVQTIGVTSMLGSSFPITDSSSLISYPPVLFVSFSAIQVYSFVNYSVNPNIASVPHNTVLRNPTSYYAPTSYIDYPIFGGDLPDILGVFYSVSAYCHFNNTIENIEVWGSFDEGAFEKIGNFTYKKKRLLINKGLGKVARTLQLRFILNRDTQLGSYTFYPTLYFPSVTCTKANFLYVLTLKLDIASTALKLKNSQEGVVTSLLSTLTPGRLLPVKLSTFSSTMNMTAKKVEVAEINNGYVVMVELHQFPNESDPDLLLYGDANQDGIVNIGDVTKIERQILGLDAATPEADANRDGVVNIGDVTTTERIILGLNK